MLVSLVVAVLIAEGAVRLLFPEWAPRTARITQFWQYDPLLGWSHVPGAEGDFSSFGFDSYVTINEKGNRGPVYPYERGCAPRMVLLGDSFVWGYGVNYPETFAGLLQEMPPYPEVVNLGVSGYSVDQELILFQNDGRRYAPDVTIVFVAANDFGNHMGTEAYLVYGKPAFRLGIDGLTLINQPVQQPSLMKRILVRTGWSSYLATQIYRLWEQSVESERTEARRQASTRLPDDPVGPFPRNRVDELGMALIEQLEYEVHDSGSKLLVVLIEDVGAPYRMSEYLEARGIPVLLMREYIDQHAADLHLDDGLHWSVAGHRIVARAVADKLAEMMVWDPATASACRAAEPQD